MVEVTTRKVPRNDLKRFIPDHRSIVAFETLQDDVISTADVLSNAQFLVLQPNDNLGAERVLKGSENISITDGGPGGDAPLDLTDTGVAADTYGSQTRILILAIDAKGRITSAEEVKIDVSDVDGVLAATNGGTGQTGYAVGDILYADTTTTLSPLADIATGNVLLSGGADTAPLWGKVNLTSAVTGVLPAANGGFPTGGFSGTGAYTNFTITNGLVTAAS